MCGNVGTLLKQKNQTKSAKMNTIESQGVELTEEELKTIAHYKNGVKNGTIKQYDGSGQLSQEYLAMEKAYYARFLRKKALEKSVCILDYNSSPQAMLDARDKILNAESLLELATFPGSSFYWSKSAFKGLTQHRIDFAKQSGINDSDFRCAHTEGATAMPSQGNPAEWGRSGGYQGARNEVERFRQILEM